MRKFARLWSAHQASVLREKIARSRVFLLAATSRLVSSWVRNKIVIAMRGKLDNMPLLSFNSKNFLVEEQKRRHKEGSLMSEQENVEIVKQGYAAFQRG